MDVRSFLTFASIRNLKLRSQMRFMYPPVDRLASQSPPVDCLENLLQVIGEFETHCGYLVHSATIGNEYSINCFYAW